MDHDVLTSDILQQSTDNNFVQEEINKKYSYSPDQILFIPHPREKSDYLKELEKSLYNYSNIKGISTITVENYLSQKNLETVIGTFSSSLYYAKSIFNKKHVYYIDFLSVAKRSHIQKKSLIYKAKKEISIHSHV